MGNNTGEPTGRWHPNSWHWLGHQFFFFFFFFLLDFDPNRAQAGAWPDLLLDRLLYINGLKVGKVVEVTMGRLLESQ
jgi:hypothetical protein